MWRLGGFSEPGFQREWLGGPIVERQRFRWDEQQRLRQFERFGSG
jgi:hypothetical protein